jgi:hypothetical protein
MRTMILTFALCGVFATTASAEPTSFPNEQALQSYWQSNPPINRTVIFVDGRKVSETSGFGPTWALQYFRCSATNDLRQACGSPFDNASTEDHIAGMLSTGYPIWLDGQLLRPGSSPTARADITTCSGDSDNGIRGPIRFYRLTFITLGLTFYASSCP